MQVLPPCRSRLRSNTHSIFWPLGVLRSLLSVTRETPDSRPSELGGSRLASFTRRLTRADEGEANAGQAVAAWACPQVLLRRCAAQAPPCQNQEASRSFPISVASIALGTIHAHKIALVWSLSMPPILRHAVAWVRQSRLSVASVPPHACASFIHSICASGRLHNAAQSSLLLPHIPGRSPAPGTFAPIREHLGPQAAGTGAVEVQRLAAKCASSFVVPTFHAS